MTATPTLLPPSDKGRLPAARWNAADEFNPIPSQKVIGIDNLLSIAWLSRALELSRSIARLVTDTPQGSCFLVKPDLLLTNNHVISDADEAAEMLVEFNFQKTWTGEMEPTRRYNLDPSHFRTSKELDYTFVRVRGEPGELYGIIDLGTRGRPAVNDYVSIIQHPMGGPKKVSLTDNKVAAVFGDVLQYSTDTEPGSSGSPVFNQDWQIVGLHHAGGELAGPDGEEHFTNEGILITSVIRDAAAFLGLSDALHDFAFGELRAALVDLVSTDGSAQVSSETVGRIVDSHPQLPVALDDWASIHAAPRERTTRALARGGVAIGGALRQWARKSGHQAIAETATPDPAPSAALKKLVGRFKRSRKVPSDVYRELLEELADAAELLEPLTRKSSRTAPDQRAPYAFLLGVAVGAKAYDGSEKARSGSRR